MRLNSLIFCDIDGCLNQGVQPSWRLMLLQQVGNLIINLNRQRIGFTLCTGRPQPFAEAMAKALGVELPLVFENGCGVYDPASGVSNMLVENPDLPTLKAAIKAYMPADSYLEPGKEASVSLSDPAIWNMSNVQQDSFTAHLEDKLANPALSFTHSASAIDITPRGIDKSHGAKHVLGLLGLKPEQTGAIGDSNGDLPLLRIVGWAACPANASAPVKQVCTFVSQESHESGTLDCLRQHVQLL